MHIGRKIEKIREIKGLKQEVLALKMGVSQQTISRLEQSETIEDEKLKLFADALDMTVESIKAFNETALFNNINSNHVFNDNSSLNNHVQCTFNPLDKLLEAIEQNKTLFERLIVEKDNVIQMQKEILELHKKQSKAS